MEQLPLGGDIKTHGAITMEKAMEFQTKLIELMKEYKVYKLDIALDAFFTKEFVETNSLFLD